MQQIVINGNNIDLLKNYPDNYFDSVVTDPPYGLGKEPIAEELMKDWIEHGYHEIKGSGFMGKEWDAFVPQPIFWKEVFRVLKHGGHVLSFFGTRTYDWGVMSMRFAGFEVRDCIQWLYGSGFPKSHNISKALDKMEGAEREVIAKSKNGAGASPQKINNHAKGDTGIGMLDGSGKEFEITAPATESAKQWDGWGTALKPANEPIVLARKPLDKGLSIAENILKWGTGGINIDASRIGTEDKTQRTNNGVEWGNRKDEYYENREKEVFGSPLGRFPANIILTHSNYQVMTLVGNIDNSKLAEIIRYFYGYTKVFDLRERKRSTSIKDKCRDEVLQCGMQEAITKEGFNTKQNSSELSELQNTIHSIQEPLSDGKKEILQSDLQRPSSEIIERGKSNEIREKTYRGIEDENGGNKEKKWYNKNERKTPTLERGQNESSRICEHNDFNTSDGLARNGEKNETNRNLHIGTQNSDGDGNEKTAIGFGECTPHKWDKERQQSEQFSNRGQGESLEEASGNRCGNGEIKERKSILEVFDFDVPTEWLRYFEYTGENLGCVCKGTKKVKSDGHHSYKRSGGDFINGIPNQEDEGNKYAENGKEEVENWDCHEDCPIRILDEQSGDRSSTRINNSNDIKKSNTNKLFGGSIQKKESYSKDYRDKGGASRYFYVAKASKSERNKGLDGFEKKLPNTNDFTNLPSARSNSINTSSGKERLVLPNQNFHPTVKPIKLMQYLVKMITPPNGIVLDPFCGSGTTGVACKLDGFQFVGLEQDPEYCKIAQARIENYVDNTIEIQNDKESLNKIKKEQLKLWD